MPVGADADGDGVDAAVAYVDSAACDCADVAPAAALVAAVFAVVVVAGIDD